MYRLSVLAILILSLLNSGFTFERRQSDGVGGSGISNQEVSSVAREVDKLVVALPKELKRLPTQAARVSKVKDTLQVIDKLRKDAPLESVDKEVAMDLSVEPLRPLAEAEAFDSGSCIEWEHRLSLDYEPSESGEITNPHLKKAQRVIASVCGR